MQIEHSQQDFNLQFGKSITQSGDPLFPVKLSRLFIGISKPKQAFKDKITQLRSVKAFSPDKYRMLKKDLPYFVCGAFSPKIRRREHFLSINCFLLDLDYLTGAEVNKSLLFDKLKKIPEVKMMFTSPSGDGLKIMFLLKEKCVDSSLFSTFYKIFAARFAEKYNLQDVTDIKTSDVTRACFMSYDPDAYWCENAVSIDMNTYLNINDFGAAEQEIKRIDKQEKTLQTPKTDTVPSADVLTKIKQKLNPSTKIQKDKRVYVPPEVEKAMDLLNQKLADFNMGIVETTPINYGRKVKIKAEQLWAEINIFYGKKGYSIVRTTKSGSNEELAVLATRVIEELLFSQPNQQ